MIQGITIVRPSPGRAQGSVLPAGPQGSSAYQLALQGGFAGPLAAWLASLTGSPGAGGERGVDGSPGVGVRSGAGTPSASLGNDGEFYYDFAGKVFFGPKVGGVWGAGVSIIGPAGPGGASNVFRSGSGAPASSLGINGDFYIDTAGGGYALIGPKAAGAWPLGRVSLVGPAGRGITGTAVNASGHLIVTYSDGATADVGLVVGARGTDGSSGAAGVGIASATVNGPGHLIVTRTDGSTVDAGYVVGLAGASGTNGTNGAAGRGVSSSVVNGSGHLVVSYTDGSSSDLGNIIGATGATGAAGATWLNGSGLPADSLGLNGDYYLDTSNGNVSRKSGGLYSVVGNIKGATGTTDYTALANKPALGTSASRDVGSAAGTVAAGNDSRIVGYTLPGSGSNYWAPGTGDGASFTTFNTKLRLHWGLGLEDNSGIVNGSYDARTGTWNVRGGYQVNGLNVWHAGNFNPAAKANLDSPTLTGAPTAPTPPNTAISTEIANAEFVANRVAIIAPTYAVRPYGLASDANNIKAALGNMTADRDFILAPGTYHTQQDSAALFNLTGKSNIRVYGPRTKILLKADDVTQYGPAFFAWGGSDFSFEDLTVDSEKEVNVQAVVTAKDLTALTLTVNTQGVALPFTSCEWIVVMQDPDRWLWADWIASNDHGPYSIALVSGFTYTISGLTWDAVNKATINGRVGLQSRQYAQDAFRFDAITGSLNIRKVRIGSVAGRAVVCTGGTEATTLDGVEVAGLNGRQRSTNSDCFHMASGRGLLRLRNCLVDGSGDDGLNAHNDRMFIDSAPASNTLLVHTRGGGHSYRVNDQVELLGPDNLPFWFSFISSITQPDATNKFTVAFYDNLPSSAVSNPTAYQLQNVTANYTLDVDSSNMFRRIRGTGIATQVRNSRIDGARFEDISGPAIFASVAGAFGEGINPGGLTIKGNTAANCNWDYYSPVGVITAAMTSLTDPNFGGPSSAVGAAIRIFITHNTVDRTAHNAFTLWGLSGFLLTHNTVFDAAQNPDTSRPYDNAAITVRNCENGAVNFNAQAGGYYKALRVNSGPASAPVTPTTINTDFNAGFPAVTT